jgi:RimJ/RimL family protein N-acetyltransferase
MGTGYNLFHEDSSPRAVGRVYHRSHDALLQFCIMDLSQRSSRQKGRPHPFPITQQRFYKLRKVSWIPYGDRMLKGVTVNLKILEKEDLPLAATWSNDPQFGGEFEPLEQNSLRDMEKWYEGLSSDERWFIIEKKDGTKIGQIVSTPQGPHFSIGYCVSPQERGKGYCTEAVKILVDFLFLSKDIVRVQAEASPENRASQKVLEKAGFTKEGVIRKSVFNKGRWHDGIMYSILREEWKEPRIVNHK